MAKSPPETVMTIAELSKYRKISRSAVYKLAEEGKLSALKVSRYGRYDRVAMDR